MVVIVGASLPVKHTVTREATYRATPAQLFELIRNVSDYPSWQKAVSKVEILPDIDGKPRMRETNSGQAITYELSDIVPNQGMTSRIADAKLPFGGSWTYEIAPGVTRRFDDVANHGERRGLQPGLPLRVEVRDGAQRDDRQIPRGRRHALPQTAGRALAASAQVPPYHS